jgi:hypothetical protein
MKIENTVRGNFLRNLRNLRRGYNLVMNGLTFSSKGHPLQSRPWTVGGGGGGGRTADIYLKEGYLLTGALQRKSHLYFPRKGIV